MNSISSNFVHLIFTFLVIIVPSISSQDEFKEFTKEVFQGSPPKGYPGAFWDVNRDRVTDMIVWNDMKIQVYESHTSLQYKHPILNKSSVEVSLPDKVGTIVNTSPGDYNGDLYLDLLIVVKTQEFYHLYLSQGNMNEADKARQWSLSDPELIEINGKALNLTCQPAVFDYDGNSIPDLLIQESGDYRVSVLSFESGWKRKVWSGLEDYGKMTAHSNAFIDINNDLISDLILSMEKEGKMSIVALPHKPFIKNEMVEDHPYEDPVVIELPILEKDLGQIVFVDFDNDKTIDPLILCTNESSHSEILTFDWNSNSTYIIDVDFNGYQIKSRDDEIPMRIHMGDYDLDGYVDAVALATKNDAQKVIILENRQGVSHGRNFVAIEPRSLPSNEGDMIAFFDAYDDGFLDLIIAKKEDGIQAFENIKGVDATWIKAAIYSGSCGRDYAHEKQCPNDYSDLVLALPVIGASVLLETTRGDGGEQHVASGFLSQSSYFALQMPAAMFGLGRSPNFVDKISVGLATPVNETADRHSKDFEQTIPNSAVVITPLPLNDPEKWRASIYVTPSTAMLDTAIVLSVVFALLGILVGLLHWKEKREDQKEKLVEMQRFHFDAM